jgi:hypothetical protein
MPEFNSKGSVCQGARQQGFWKRWGRDTSGATAIEFAVIAFPFFLFAFGVLGMGLLYFTNTSLEHAVESAARKIRTGQAQTEGKTLANFKQMVCDQASGYIKCDNKLQIHVQSGTGWAAIVPKPCVTNGQLTPSSGVGTDALKGSSGEAGAVVLVTACYEWDMAQKLPFLLMGNLGNGSALVQAVSTFRTEPYQ